MMGAYAQDVRHSLQPHADRMAEAIEQKANNLEQDGYDVVSFTLVFWRESRVTFSVADESPQPVAARLCSVRLRFRCFFPRFRNSIPQTIACNASPSSNA